VYLFGFSRIFLLGILIFKGVTARRLYKSFGVTVLYSFLIFPWSLGPASGNLIYHEVAQDSVLLTQYCAGDKIEKNEMGGAFSTDGAGERRV
jgi:hypothetical protein